MVQKLYYYTYSKLRSVSHYTSSNNATRFMPLLQTCNVWQTRYSLDTIHVVLSSDWMVFKNSVTKCMLVSYKISVCLNHFP